MSYTASSAAVPPRTPHRWRLIAGLATFVCAACGRHWWSNWYDPEPSPNVCAPESVLASRR